LAASLLGSIVLIAAPLGCTGSSNIEQSVKNKRKPIPPKPGDEPYQTAIRNYLVQTLPDPDFDDVKWYTPVEQREGLGVRFKYRAKRPGTTIKDEYDHIFVYTKKGEVRNMSKPVR